MGNYTRVSLQVKSIYERCYYRAWDKMNVPLYLIEN